MQPLEAGVGPMLHRTYGVRITGSDMKPQALIDLVAARLNQASPEMASGSRLVARMRTCGQAARTWPASRGRGGHQVLASCPAPLRPPVPQHRDLHVTILPGSG